MRKTRIGFISLGCPKNQVDTEVMLHELITAGYEIAEEDIKADIIVVNTCAFIADAKKESIDTILDIAWLKSKRLRGIIVTGCMAERYRDEVLSEFPEVDAVLGVGSIHKIVEVVKEVDERTKSRKKKNDGIIDGEPNIEPGTVIIGDGVEEEQVSEAETNDLTENDLPLHDRYSSYDSIDDVKLGGERVVTTPDYYAYLKIAEGCDNRCSYCIIPYLRGRYRSRTMEDIVEEAKSLEHIGVKELILVAQDTSRYGKDLYGKYCLSELIHKITESTNIPWIRILYCYPDKITDELIAEIRDNPRVVKYIDLPIQHISDKVLSAMNRHGDRNMICNVIGKLRENIPNIVIRTTAIAGFPGETEDDFEQLCCFIKETKFERFGAFAYSREEGTPAYDMDCQIDDNEKQERCDILMKMQLQINDRFNRKKVGKKLQVLCEGYDPVAESYYGRSYMDAPEIDGKIYFTSEKKLQEGIFVDVRITDVLDYDLIGEVSEQ